MRSGFLSLGVLCVGWTFWTFNYGQGWFHFFWGLVALGVGLGIYARGYADGWGDCLRALRR